MLRMLLALVAAAALPFGGLYINSLPIGADVWVDGSYVGRTPLLIDGLRVGKHAVTVTKAGWKVQELDDDVAPGVVTPSTVQLQQTASSMDDGTLAIQGVAEGTVAVDDRPAVHLEPKMDMIPGVHDVIVRTSDLKFERSVVIYPNQTTHVLLRTPSEERSAVVAPLEAYMPASVAKVTGDKVVVRWNSHVAIGHVGDARFLVDGHDVVYDAPAGMVRGRLYLPLDLILTLTGGKATK